MQGEFQVTKRLPMTNAERQRRWRERHRPRKRKPLLLLDPNENPRSGPLPTFQTRANHPPMTNAERQRRWRERHRRRKPGVQWLVANMK